MSLSSGQNFTERTEHRECKGCEWSGDVDVWSDPELSMTGWECLGCGGETFDPH